MLEPTAAMREAIEFLTLWMEPEDGRRRAGEHILSVLDVQDIHGQMRVFAGFLGLSELLLLQLVKERGAKTADEIDRQSREYLREFSRQLPE